MNHQPSPNKDNIDPRLRPFLDELAALLAEDWLKRNTSKRSTRERGVSR